MNSQIAILTAVSLVGFGFSFLVSRDWFGGGDAIGRGVNALLFFLAVQTAVAAAGVWLIVLLVKYWNELGNVYKIAAVAGALPVAFYIVFILAPVFRLLSKP